MKRALLIAIVISAALPGAARATFSPPHQVAAPSGFHRGFLAVADATGRLTVATRSAFDVPRLIERPAGGGAWTDLPPVAGIAPRSSVSSSSMAAAGDGALAIAWSVSRRFDFSMLVVIRPPGGTLSAPFAVAGPAAGGVDHPAIAIDAAGDVLIAYQTATKASHLRLQGRIAVAYRPAGRAAFVGPVVVERVLGTPPVVALAADGTGVVAWTRNRTLKAVTVGPRGAIGATRALARDLPPTHPLAAAGSRSAASIAYAVNGTAVHGKRITHRTSVRVISRPPGGTFGRAQRIFASAHGSRDLAIAADEQGRATLAWTDVRSVTRGIAPGRILAAAGRVGGRFGRPRMLAARDEPFPDVTSVAARNGHVALSWAGTTEGRQTGVHVAAGRWNEPLAAELLPSGPIVGPTVVAVAADGRTTAFWRAGGILAADGP